MTYGKHREESNLTAQDPRAFGRARRMVRGMVEVRELARALGGVPNTHGSAS